MMRKYFILLFITLLAGNVSAQKRVVPTPEQVARATRATTNVVLTGDNMLLDMALKSAVEKRWKLTPVKFIDNTDFNENIGDANQLFLIVVDGKFKKDKAQNNYVFLNLLMGGALEIDNLSDFILLPLLCEGQDEDKAIAFMEAFVDIVQYHLQYLQENPKQAKSDLDTYNANIARLASYQILMQPADIAFAFSEEELLQLFNDHLTLVTDKEIEKAMATGAAAKAAALTLYPVGDEATGGYCYNLIITCDTHELMYYKRHKITGAGQAGFLKEEIKRLSRPFKK